MIEPTLKEMTAQMDPWAQENFRALEIVLNELIKLAGVKIGVDPLPSDPFVRAEWLAEIVLDLQAEKAALEQKNARLVKRIDELRASKVSTPKPAAAKPLATVSLNAAGKPTYTVPEFCFAHSISRTHLYKLINEGKGPRLMKIGRRTLVSTEAAVEWARQNDGR